jgi:soluble lytic murein transglycosylase-like protein
MPAVADPAAAVTGADLAQAPALPDIAIADPARHAAGIPPRYAAKIADLSARFDLSPSLLEALVWQESRWNANAVSPVGAQGLAQLMPGTARYLGVDPRDPFANLEGGARYLREQLWPPTTPGRAASNARAAFQISAKPATMLPPLSVGWPTIRACRASKPGQATGPRMMRDI